MPRRTPRAHRDIIILWYAKLGSTRAVAERTGFSRTKVQRYLRAAEVEMRPAGRPKK